ncbi:MAG: peptidoglycan-binding domain-containing protein [Myxococcota bacterium]
MTRRHTIEPGDHVVRLAYDHGHERVEAVWSHPDNASLRSRRPDPGVLAPGDVVAIPEAAPRVLENLPTRRRHRVVIPLPLPTLKLRLQRPGDIPYAYVRCRVELDGERHDLSTGPEGDLEIELGPHTRELSLEWAGQWLELDIAFLQPVDSEPGWLARLENLGYAPGPDTYGVRSAIEEFQCDHGLTVDGEVGPQTQRALLEAHGA